MSAIAAVPIQDLTRRAQRLQLLTIVWMTGEAAVAMAAAWKARSPALLGSSSFLSEGTNANKQHHSHRSRARARWRRLFAGAAAHPLCQQHGGKDRRAYRRRRARRSGEDDWT